VYGTSAPGSLSTAVPPHSGRAGILKIGVHVAALRRVILLSFCIRRGGSGRDMAGQRGNWLCGTPEVQFRAFCALADDLRTAIAGWHPGGFGDAEVVCVRRAIG
jgi:hypothetical protein